MYFPIGLPKRLNVNVSDNDDEPFQDEIQAVVCNRDRNLFAILCDKSLSIWLCKPCIRVGLHRRSEESVQICGANRIVEWRPDSSMLVVATNKKALLFYSLTITGKESYEQEDAPQSALKRHSAELYTKRIISSSEIHQKYMLNLGGNVTSLVCLRDELMVATTTGRIQRVRWNGDLNSDYCINLCRVPFCDDQLVLKAVPLDDPGAHISHLEYSPLVGGFAIVLSDGRAAFLTATTLKFDPNAVQGIWAKELEDATCTAVNHKYRLLAFGRSNSQGLVMSVDPATGGLEVCQKLELSSKDYPGHPGPVGHLRWTPDATVLALCWKYGGFSLWSVFGSMLTCSLQWDSSPQSYYNPLIFRHMEWGPEGYEIWCVKDAASKQKDARGKASVVSMPPFSGTLPEEVTTDEEEPLHGDTCVLQYSLLKSALTVNPCMSRLEHVLLQGSDRLYLSTQETAEGEIDMSGINGIYTDDDDDEGAFESDPYHPSKKTLKVPFQNVAASRQWMIVPIPYSYTAANWPIRYTCVDDGGENIGVAGKNGVAHCCLKTQRWHLFGNESQEDDMVVTGGLMWWGSEWLILGAYSIPANADQIRLYPRNQKLDDEFATIVSQPAQVLLLNMYGDQLIVLTANCCITLYNLYISPSQTGKISVTVTRIQEVDISGLTVHPACVISVCLTSLRTESWRSPSNQPVQPPAQSIIFNISGRVLMIQREHSATDNKDLKLFHAAQMTPIVLASCCESLWCATRTVSHKPHLSHALWLHCGAHGTRAWLPLFPAPGGDRGHAFMARRIMLPFTPSIYPLAVLFEEAIMIGAETSTSIVACDMTTLFQPLATVERTSLVYLHHLLRQLLRRNLGYHAWEVASTCQHLPYFPHALELLLHQVLEEEATSKDPIPDSLLPRVLDFIREFPVFLLTVVQCARKTELALWRYLFSVAGSPRHLFSQALEQGQLETAASYLIILQNLESSLVSRSHATRLLDSTLDAAKWDLSKDLIRFLRSIDPNDFESPRASVPMGPSTKIGFSHTTPPVSPQCADEDLSMIMPNTQALRGRSLSTTSGPKQIGPESLSMSPQTSGHHVAMRTVSDSSKGAGLGWSLGLSQATRKASTESYGKEGAVEEYFIDVILKRHAKKLLMECRLRALGTMAAHIDFPLVSWLRKERSRAAAVNDFVSVLRTVHADFSWPLPSLAQAACARKYSGSSAGSIDAGKMAALDDRLAQMSLSLAEGSLMSGGAAEVGDSGYLSQSTHTGGTVGTPLTPQHTSGIPAAPTLLQNAADHASFNGPKQALLMPRSSMTGDLMSILSEDGSVYGDDVIIFSNDLTNDDPTRNILARPPDPSPQSYPKPPPHAEVQLRYLLQIFLEAGCLEFSIILAVVLRDAMAILRVISLAKGPDTPLGALIRLTNGMKNLTLFANTQCLGYQSVMSAVMGQAKVLQRLAEARETSARTPTEPGRRDPKEGSRDLSDQRRFSLGGKRLLADDHVQEASGAADTAKSVQATRSSGGESSGKQQTPAIKCPAGSVVVGAARVPPKDDGSGCVLS